jgi:thiol-disulfide isomerase/thioredoxin
LPLSTVVVAGLLAIAIGLLGAGLIFGAGGDGDDGDTAPLDPNAPAPTLGAAPTNTVGEDAPTEPYETFAGGQASVADYQGRPLVVNFWASWCVPCVTEMPAFEEVFQERGDEVAFLGLSVRDAAGPGQDRIEETGITYDVGRDPSGSLLTAFGGVAMPTTVLVDEDGVIVRLLSGETSADELRDALAEAFPEAFSG